MNNHIHKIQQITKGIAQLFSSMDQGFVKVESDIVLIKEFRYLCYYANERLELSHNKLIEELKPLQNDADIVVDEALVKNIRKHLDSFRQSIELSIGSLNSYKNDYARIWKKTLSIEVLNKFCSVLANEAQTFDQETEHLLMELLYRERQSKLSSRNLPIENVENPNFDQIS